MANNYVYLTNSELKIMAPFMSKEHHDVRVLPWLNVLQRIGATVQSSGSGYLLKWMKPDGTEGITSSHQVSGGKMDWRRAEVIRKDIEDKFGWTEDTFRIEGHMYPEDEEDA
ncbi:hypothetical protein QCA50_019082 [Cerrena zonata]|uniref:Uncharacterized protein n=1 Tax=Cerrena zonata TaxID=2478898 RepID=A0AAW0FKY5_9APHY